MHKNTYIKIWPLLILFHLLLLSTDVYSQNSAITSTDSLRTLLATKTGTAKIAIQLDLARQVKYKNVDEAKKLAHSALHNATKAKDNNLIMRAYLALGDIYLSIDNSQSVAYFESALLLEEATEYSWYKGEILYKIGVNKYRLGENIVALESFNAAIQACRQSKNFKTMGASYSMMGSTFRMNGLYDRAIEYIIKAKLNYTKANFIEGSAWSAFLLGQIYFNLKVPEIALDYTQEALAIYLKQAALDGNQNGVAMCYEQIALLYLELGNFEEARKNIAYTLKIHTNASSSLGISNVHKNLGKIEYAMGNYKLAEKHLNQAVQLQEAGNYRRSLPSTYEYLGLTLFKRGRVEKGFETIYRGLELAISNNQKKIELEIYSRLGEAYLAVKDYKNAIRCKNKQIEIQSLILSGNAFIKTEQLQTIYEIDEKNQQIAGLEKQNKINALNIKQQKTTRNGMILVIILILLIATIIYYFYYKLRQKNSELHEINAAKDKFFAIIGHDLRGPTGTLAALLEHLNSSFDNFSMDELKKLLSILHKSAVNVSKLLENLLIWAQSQVGKIEYTPTVLVLDDVFHHELKNLKQSADNKQIDIRLELNKPISVLADLNMLQTIVRNIISNAIKFTQRDGTILVKSEIKNKDTALVQIIDNGVGIKKENLLKIFEISNTFHTKGTEDEQSTGLGLILVKDFIEKNKGILSIESEFGEGTTVSFTLPINNTNFISK
ncbi:tetratricopeptide repeat protein [Labilibaculum sp. DW002]|uniref:histidine kinase n=1 Tax=Paralabilibaculum antarcticum TaxID=2912572 RepID=A0ABT5VUP5_9BACT|nr:tetratricopeptide repeat protein [Labilibaculum sp. DW002]MDE5418004.1 tetratricopeptide repeat protein [Labilibaculum sp. DW002]